LEVIELVYLFLVYAATMYFANAAPIILHGKVPVDLGKKLFGERILGDGKTILGALSGVLIGVSAGSMVYFIIPIARTIPEYFLFVVSLSAGAIIGDIVKSFFKRRLKIKSGQQWALADQLDFIVGGLVFSSFVRTPEIEIVVALLVLTIFVHSATNYIAYKVKLKNVPW